MPHTSDLGPPAPAFSFFYWATQATDLPGSSDQAIVTYLDATSCLQNVMEKAEVPTLTAL